jgi:hypothetical protein
MALAGIFQFVSFDKALPQKPVIGYITPKNIILQHPRFHN